jgi:hypothetical protein
METTSRFLGVIPVLPSSDIARDIVWYKEKTGFETVYADNMYAVLYRENLSIHLQWHADSPTDPLLGGSVIRIVVKNVERLFEEFVRRGTVRPDKFIANTPWKTNEFGFYDPNRNAIFIMEDID